MSNRWIHTEKLIASRAQLFEKLPEPPLWKPEEEGGCGVTGFACSIPVSGRHIIAPSCQMHNRGNGKGGGIAAVGLLDEFRGGETLGVALLALSFVTAGSAYRRWALNERSMRLNAPLPPSRLPMLMAIGTAVIALIASVMLVVDRS